MIRETFSCDDILLVPRYSEIPSRSLCCPGVDKYKIPLMSAPMDKVYSPELDRMMESKGAIATVHRYFNNYKEQLASTPEPVSTDYRFFAVGSINGNSKEWIDGLLDSGIKHFLVDMAHGDSKACVDTVKYLKEKCPDSKIIAGNVATKSGFSRLEDAGAWAIRVGIGSGSICSTRLNTGFGVPLLTAVEDCSQVRKSAYLIADGGIKNPGDIAKAIAFGADFAMMGKMIAATDLGPGRCYNSKGSFLCEYSETNDDFKRHIAYKEYRGMASKEARKGVLKYASIEGVSGMIEYTGSTEQFLTDIELNLRASLSYAGAGNWSDFRRSVKKIRITNASLVESNTHVVNHK